MFGRLVSLVSVGVVAVAMTGCGIGPAASGNADPVAIMGRAMGGQQPVSGAAITVYRAATSGYGGASISEMTNSVMTDSGGGFVLTLNYHCNSDDDQVYVVAKGGNPGLSAGTNNGELALMAALGRCGNLNSSTHIIINEVTTVAAAWALSQFMTSYDHLATSSGNVTGLKNAFAMAANLASVDRGFSPGDAPAGSVVPTDKINHLANALAACVNSDGSAPACPLLMSAGGAGTATNTIDAALHIVQNPGTDVAAVWAIPTGDAPFQPGLATPPTDWTMGVAFQTGPTVASNLAIDATGNLWAVASDGLYELNAAGFQQPSYPSLAGNNVAVDPSGNLWVALSGSSQVAKMPANLSAPVFYSVATSGSGTGVDGGLAIDGSGDVWYTCKSCLYVYELNPDGTAKAQGPSNGGGLLSTTLSIDPSENVWAGNFTYSGFYVLKPDATLYPNEPFSCGGSCGRSAYITNDAAGQGWFIGYDLTIVNGVGGTTTNVDSPSGGLFNPAAVAIDGGGHGWVANTNNILSLSSSPNTTAGSLSAFDSTGAALSPATGYSSSTLSTPQGIAVDGSGNVWMRNTGAPTVTVFVGLAKPVVTPFSLGLKNGTLGKRP